MLEMKHRDVPSKMLYWIVDNFNPLRCQLELPGGRSLRVTEEDVHLMLGLPRGTIEIKKRVKNCESKMLSDWQKRFTSPKTSITLGNICDAMLADVEGSPWFCRHFIVLMTWCLVESTANGSVSPQIMDYLEDVDNIVNLKWCEFVIRALVDTAAFWKQAKNQRFTGPALFITLFYADRVTNGCTDIIERGFPAFVNWCDYLRQRQNLEINLGSFGEGRIEAPFVPAKIVENVDNNVDGDAENSNPVLRLRKGIEKHVKIILETMARMKSLLALAPPEIIQNVAVRKALEEVVRVRRFCRAFEEWKRSLEAPQNENILSKDAEANKMQQCMREVGDYGKDSSVAGVQHIKQENGPRPDLLKREITDNGGAFAIAFHLNMKEEEKEGDSSN